MYTLHAKELKIFTQSTWKYSFISHVTLSEIITSQKWKNMDSLQDFHYR
jgi:hypothetical protein